MAIKYYSSIDLNTNELQKAVIENTTAPGSPVEGQIYYDTTDDTIYFRNASAWVDMGSGAVSGNTFATDLKIGRDAHNLIDFTTDDAITFRVADADEITLNANNFGPTTSDGIALGTTSKMWSDLFLASGAVINFNNGDVTATHSSNTLTIAGGTLAAAAITGTTIDASTDFTIGNLVVTDNAITATAMDINAGSGTFELTTSGAMDINSGALTLDGSTLSIDGTDDSNLTITGSGKDLDIAVAGGSTQELRLTSAGTGASAMHLNASAGGINIDSADMIDVDAADEITITTTSADGHISLVSAHTAGVAVHIDADANAGSIVDIDAGILDIDVSDTVAIDAADEIIITTGSADGHISLVSAHTAGQAIHLDGDANAGSIVDIDAGILDIDVTGESTLDTTLLTLTGVGGLKILDTTTSFATES